MECFYCTQDVQLRLDDQRIDLRAHPRAAQPSPQHVYCATGFLVRRIARRFAEQAGREGTFRTVAGSEAVRAFEFPAYLGGATPDAGTAHDLSAILGRLARSGGAEKLSLGVFNGFGTAIGDTIVGLSALRCARELIVAQGGPAFGVDLIVHPEAVRRVDPVARLDPLVNRVVSMPQPMSRIQKYDGLWDFDSVLLDPRFNDAPMIDYFLDRLGVDPALVKPGAKNNVLRLPRASKKLETALAGIPGRMLLFHPQTSSAVRTIPDVHARRIAGEILQRTDYTVASAVPVDIVHPRFVNLAPLSASFVDLCHIVSHAERIVTADTSVYHIASAFGVATVVLFTTIAPELRVKYYPSVAGILLDGAEDTPYFMAHKVKGDVSPETVFALWERFDVGAALRALESRGDAAPGRSEATQY